MKNWQKNSWKIVGIELKRKTDGKNHENLIEKLMKNWREKSWNMTKKNHENLTEKITKKNHEKLTEKSWKIDEKILWKIYEKINKKSDGKTKNVARFARVKKLKSEQF